MLDAQKSQSPGRAPQISSITSLGFPSFSNSLWTAIQDLLPCNVYSSVFTVHNISVANPLTAVQFSLASSQSNVTLRTKEATLLVLIRSLPLNNWIGITGSCPSFQKERDETRCSDLAMNL